MNHTAVIRNLVLGEGIPKICVPVMGKYPQEVYASAKNALEQKPDLIEWRADFLENVQDMGAVCAILRELRAMLGDTPLLFTFRTKGEGGEQELALEQYGNLCSAAIQSGCIDALDVELFLKEETVESLLALAHDRGVCVILSNHDFQKTPPAEELFRRLQKMQELGADVAKIAVMPQCKADVLALLTATETAARTLQIPVITMSMGAQGAVSRLLGECFGSSLTFGMAGRASAPGQIPAGELRDLLEKIHRYTV